MLKNNEFFIKNLKNVVFLGFSQVFEDLIKINNKLGIKTNIITSSDQSKEISSEHVVFDQFDGGFEDYIKNNFKIESTIFISVSCRVIFNSDVIKFLGHNLVNFHGSRLPYDSGGGSFSWQILREDRINNQLVHLIDEGIDTGPIIDSKLSIFPPNCKVPIDFKNYHLKKFLEFYSNFINKIKKGHEFELKKQVDYLGRYNPRLSTIENGYINWNYNPYDLINFINAFDDPYLGAITFLNRNNYGELHIKSAHLHAGDSPNHPFMSGIVSRHDKDWIVVSTVGKHSLLIEKVVNSEGENIIKKIVPGDRFYTPIHHLDESTKKKVTYTSLGKK